MPKHMENDTGSSIAKTTQLNSKLHTVVEFFSRPVAQHRMYQLALWRLFQLALWRLAAQ